MTLGFTILNQDLTFIMFLGVGKHNIASGILLVGFYPVIQNPANSTSFFFAKLNFSVLKMMPLLPEWAM